MAVGLKYMKDCDIGCRIGNFGSDLTSLGMMVKTNLLYHKEKFVCKEKYQERIIKKGGRNEFFDRLFLC